MYTPWSLKRWSSEGELRLEPVPQDDLDAIVDGIRFVTERINEGPRTAAGSYLQFVRERLDAPAVKAGGPLFSYDVRCGFAGPRAPRNHLLFHLDPAAGSPSDECQVVRDYLSALVRAWEADHVSVSPLSFLKAQRHKTPQVRVGWLTYIRDDVPLEISAVPDGVHIESADGGRYLTLSGTPQEPSLDQALAIRRALGYPT